jgi:hypothetical protein
MPDHVHLILTPLTDGIGRRIFPLPEIMKAIKGTSSHTVSRRLDRHEAIWQEESFDHVLQSDESLDAKIAYILQNPVRAGLSVWRMNIHGRGASRLRFRMRRQIRCSVPSTIHIGAGAPTRPARRRIASAANSMGKRRVCTTPNEGILGYVYRGDVGITRDGLGPSHPPR